jgi:DNA-binding response OmpR family regulator
MAVVGVCEDDEAIRRLVSEALRAADHDVRLARTGSEAVERLGPESGVEVLIIDIGLPDSDGRDVCQALRAGGQHAPVLFLTALDAVHERVSGFHAGGDDYVTKPFALSELLVRVDALLKRRRPVETEPLGFRLDPERFALRTPTGDVTLTPTEFRLVATLIARTGDVVRRRALVAAGWPDGAIVHDNTLDSFIRRIRTKLERVEAAVVIETVRGVGYVLR